jgi:hypothetical protein
MSGGYRGDAPPEIVTLGVDNARQSLGGFYTQRIVVSSSAFRTLAAGDDINVNELQSEMHVLIVHDFGKEKEREERDPKQQEWCAILLGKWQLSRRP